MTTDPNTENRGFGVRVALEGYGTTRYLKFEKDAKFKPDGEHYLNVTEKFEVESALRVDLSGIALSTRKKVPLLKVPASLGSVATAALATVRNSPPAGWSFVSRTVGGDIHYYLLKNEFSIVIR